mmetsp:Transcript_18201/g.52574  ORF Transcript_18201/g.52574 Transcript_18201/m.52574 type:complete len:233 (-) Transcript_18201:448-1146(-)
MPVAVRERVGMEIVPDIVHCPEGVHSHHLDARRALHLLYRGLGLVVHVLRESPCPPRRNLTPPVGEARSGPGVRRTRHDDIPRASVNEGPNALGDGRRREAEMTPRLVHLDLPPVDGRRRSDDVLVPRRDDVQSVGGYAFRCVSVQEGRYLLGEAVLLRVGGRRRQGWRIRGYGQCAPHGEVAPRGMVGHEMHAGRQRNSQFLGQVLHSDLTVRGSSRRGGFLVDGVNVSNI